MVLEKWKQKNIDLRLCRECGKPRKHSLSACCPSCAKKASNRSSAYKKKKREEWKEAGLCYQCGKAKETEKLRCNMCHDKLMAYNFKTRKVRENRRISESTCIQCGDELSHKSHKLCDKCLFKEYAKHATKTKNNWGYLRDLLVKQDYKCAYTGENIVFGLNASIDHIIPKSHNDYPGDKELSNLCWTTKRINIVKNILSRDEFVNLCKKVIEHVDK